MQTTAIMTKAHSDARGVMASTCPRRRHINQKVMGGTTQAWVKVSRVSQILVMASTVSRYCQPVTSHRASRANRARRQPGLRVGACMVVVFIRGCAR
jgi:hypothetical protein